MRHAAAWTIAIAVALAGVAEAQPADPPWAHGVTPEQRDRASRLLAEGNELYLKSRFREALARYQEALAVWDHPSIRFNIVRALVQLDRTIEAYENVRAALRYGQGPLDTEHYQNAVNLERLLRRQIAEIQVTCMQSQVRVTLDGQELVRCPGEGSLLLAPGTHQVVAKRPGFLTLTRDLIVLPGPTTSIDVALISIEDATTTERRWASWKPWAVAGGGALLGGLGVLLRRQAEADMRQYGRNLEAECQPVACREDTPLTELAARAETENHVAIGAMVAGGVAVATGLTLVLLNRPYPVLQTEAPGPTIRILPEVTPTSVGASVVHRF